MTITHTCEECGTVVEGDGLESFGDAYIAHARRDHPDWPFPDTAIRNYAEATQRLAPVRPRLEALGEVEVHPVTEDRLEDWLAFFDRDAFAGNPAWAACYCTEPHLLDPAAPPPEEHRTWRQNRDVMSGLLRAGRSFGYLAYVDGVAAGWVNASMRSEYALYRQGGGAQPPDGDVIGVSCFVIAPPYRRHGLATRLLERVLADAAGRGAAWVEAYPFTGERSDDAGNFRGPRSLFEAHGFEAVAAGERHTTMRRAVAPGAASPS